MDDIQKAMELMREYQSQVLTVLCLPRTCRKQKDTLLKFVDNCVFVESGRTWFPASGLNAICAV